MVATMTQVPADLSIMPLSDLREARTRARRSLELARMRAHPEDSTAAERLEKLRLEVELLTEELIHRYAEDLSLVDSLLGGAYAQSKARNDAPLGQRAGGS
jgi:hypothetical protein